MKLLKFIASKNNALFPPWKWSKQQQYVSQCYFLKKIQKTADQNFLFTAWLQMTLDES